MPLPAPSIEDRGYQDFLNEALARIPAHTPEWTNWSDADPGVVLLQLFAFMAESVAYRTTLVPERTRRAFLSLLGRPLNPGAPARGLVTLGRSWRAPPLPLTVPAGARISGSGGLGFRLDQGVRVLPVEARVFVKTALDDAQVSATALAYYQAYYKAKTLVEDAGGIRLYQATEGDLDLDLAATVDNAVYIALLAPPGLSVAEVRAALGGEVLCLGLVPAPTGEGRRAAPTGSTDASGGVEVSCATASGQGRWGVLAGAIGDLTGATVVQVELPEAAALDLDAAWDDLEPTDAGVGELPPDPGDEALSARLVTWIRVRPTLSKSLKLKWIGVNAGLVTQGEEVSREPLGAGAGTPDQRYALSRAPIIAGSLTVEVRDDAGAVLTWSPVEDLYLAAREGDAGSQVYQADPATGELRFGDGVRGARPRGVVLASYTRCDGTRGNQGAGELSALASAAALTVTNPLPTWGGCAAESLESAERAAASWLQHRDRLVTVHDFETLARATPSTELARVDVIPAYHPGLEDTDPGDAPGAVTVLVLAPYAEGTRVAPEPDDRLHSAVCAWLSPRRLVTTELFVRGPTWVRIGVSVGVEVSTGDRATAVAAARIAVERFLSAQPVEGYPRGWTLGRTIKATEIAAAASRAPGVSGVRRVRLVDADTGSERGEIPLAGLELPWLVAVDVSDGDPAAPGPAAKPYLPVPVLPDECR